MNNEITAQDSGVSVYGIKQMSYTVNGQQGKDFGAAISHAAIQNAVTVEQNAEAVAAAIKLRSRKIESLGKLLAIIADATAQMPGSKDTPKSDDVVKYQVDSEKGKMLKSLVEELKKYDYDLATGWGKTKGSCTKSPTDDYSVMTISRKDAMTAQVKMQQMLDREDNDLQQDRMTLQGFVSKSNKAYQMAGDMLNKVSDSAAKVLRNIQ